MNEEPALKNPTIANWIESARTNRTCTDAEALKYWFASLNAQELRVVDCTYNRNFELDMTACVMSISPQEVSDLLDAAHKKIDAAKCWIEDKRGEIP